MRLVENLFVILGFVFFLNFSACWRILLELSGAVQTKQAVLSYMFVKVCLHTTSYCKATENKDQRHSK